MFQKPHRVKSSVTVRNSDRRKIRTRLTNFFPTFTEDQLNGLVPAKGDLKENKIYTNKGEALSGIVIKKFLIKKVIFCNCAKVLTFENEPLLLELKCGTLCPYLYGCWKFDLDLPSLHVAPFLLQKFSGGADLMAPGIIIPPVKGLGSFGSFEYFINFCEPEKWH